MYCISELQEYLYYFKIVVFSTHMINLNVNLESPQRKPLTRLRLISVNFIKKWTDQPNKCTDMTKYI